MSTTYEIHIVSIEELGNNISAESKRDTTIVLTPSLHVLVWIGPEEIAQEAGIWHICGPHDTPDLLHGLEVRREAAVTTEDLLVDYGRYGQAVEAVRERLP